MSARHIGSRGSDLALWQSRTVLKELNSRAPAAGWHSDITVITTRGDVDQSPYLAGSVEKGFFTRELEVALLERRIDLVVHSLKDLPTAEPQGLANRTILPRASAADWLLIRREFYLPREDGLLPLKPGARVGASSLRRGALLGRYAPHAVSVPLRGNVPTRLRKLGEQQGVDAIVLAAAGLTRLQLDMSAFAVVELAPSGGCRRPGRARWPLNAASTIGKSPRRWMGSPIPPVPGPPAGSASSCASSKAVVPLHLAATWSAGVRISASPPSAAGPPAASTTEESLSKQEGKRDSFIRAAVTGCKPVELDPESARTLSRTLLAR
jgi:hypothetical protein